MIKYPPKEFWPIFKEARGAMSCAEAIFMYNACQLVPDEGEWVEMGTCEGKSALASLMAWVDRRQHKLFLLEPDFKHLDFLQKAEKNVLKFKKEFNGETICLYCPEYSTDFLPKFPYYSYIMWDSGDHGEELVQAEKYLLEDRVISGGIVVLHDLHNQFTAVARAYEQLVNTGKYEPVVYDWAEILDYVKENNLEDGNNSWHIYNELPHPPNFIGALKRK